jgi:DNA end-binding protein Ku
MPAPRAIWKGHLKISLVTVPVSVHNATSSASRISLNQLHKDCGQRLKQQMICPTHGQVSRTDIVKGYEFQKDQYVVISEEELEQIKQATSKTIEITRFIDEGELDPMFLDSPYYLAPDGPVAEKAYRVIRDAMKKLKKVGLGRYVMSAREHIVALQPHDKGFVMTTLRSADEVRKADEYFSDVQSAEADKGELKLAEDLIRNYHGELDTSEFRDRYQDALLALVQAKAEGAQPVIAQPKEEARTMNFMAALEESLKAAKKKAAAPAATKAKKPPAKSVKPAAAVEKKRKKA